MPAGSGAFLLCRMLAQLIPVPAGHPAVSTALYPIGGEGGGAPGEGAGEPITQ